MPVAKITKSAVDRMQPNSVLWDETVVGFGARRGTGRVHYLLRYRFQGRQTFRRIGTHGSPFTPETARQEALRLLGQIVSGTNPSVAPREGATFGAELDRYLATKNARASSMVHIERHLRRQAAPLHLLALGAIDRRAIAQVLSEIERNSGSVARNRLRTSLSAFFTWLIAEGIVETNPVAGTSVAQEGPSRDRVLSAVELSAIWKALGADDASDIIRLLILTGQRRDEIARLRWNEVDFDRAMIVLPPQRTKNKTKHELPLAPSALEILRRRWAANANGKGNDAPVFRTFSWAFAKERLDAKLNNMDHWTIHDLRRTAASGMQRLDVRVEVIERVLNHISGSFKGVTGIYQRDPTTDAMRDATGRWAQHIEQITKS